MGLLIYIIIIATCYQCLNLGGYNSPSEINDSDRTLFVVLPLTIVFWIFVKKTKNMEK